MKGKLTLMRVSGIDKSIESAPVCSAVTFHNSINSSGTVGFSINVIFVVVNVFIILKNVFFFSQLDQ